MSAKIENALIMFCCLTDIAAPNVIGNIGHGTKGSAEVVNNKIMIAVNNCGGITIPIELRRTLEIEPQDRMDIHLSHTGDLVISRHNNDRTPDIKTWWQIQEYEDSHGGWWNAIFVKDIQDRNFYDYDLALSYYDKFSEISAGS